MCGGRKVSYAGKILRIDLTSGEIGTSGLDPDDQKGFLGSRGLAAKMLYDHAPDQVGPFDAENPFCFAVGPLTGTPAFGPNGYFTTVSPLTNGYMDSGIKGHLPANLKLAGYDGFIITGKAENPVYLFIDNDHAELRDAGEVWGKDSLETDRLVKEDLQRSDVHVAAIGPAGENRVRYACISADLYRQAGRGGGGAVMGSKNLKAIAVRGDGVVPIAHPEEFLDLVRKLHASIRENAEPLRSFGTLWLVDAMNDYRLLPTRNFQIGQIAHPERLNGEYAKTRANKKDRGCYSCSLLCANLISVKGPDGKLFELEGPEYESLVLLGPNCGLESFERIAYLNHLCDRLGIDTISAGGVLSFLMELHERGIITPSDINGVTPAWGDGEAMAQILEAVAFRKGAGDVLAEGSLRAAKAIGKESLGYAMQVKGMELPAYDPRGAVGMALAYATSDRGGCHLRSWSIYEEVMGDLDQYGYEGKAALVAARQSRKVVIDSLGVCEQMGLLPIYADLYAAATGFGASTLYNDRHEALLEDFTIEGGPPVGGAIYTLTRAFNVKRGFGRKDDALPARFFKEPLKTLGDDVPPIKEDVFEKMMDEFYALRGWDENGVPTKETLEKYGLDGVMSDLY